MSSPFANPHPDTLIVTRPFIWLVVYTVVTGALYFLVTHFPMGVVRVIQPTGFDAHIARQPYTLPLYLSYGLIMPTLVLLGRRYEWLLPAFLRRPWLPEPVC
jgi:hypothetical protein